MSIISDQNHAEHPLARKSIVLIGMPGAGKSTIGRRLASRLNIPFMDSDQEVETAAGMTIPQIFEKLGEPAFRDGERKVIARLLSGPQIVLSTGGGAFMNEMTRALILRDALSLWLKADLEVLLERTSRTNDRPLLAKGDPRTILMELRAKREPTYAQATLTVLSEACPVEETTDTVLRTLQAFYAAQGTAP